MRKTDNRFLMVGRFSLSLFLFLAGCNAFRMPKQAENPSSIAAPEWKAFDVATEQELEWSQLIESLLMADVIVVGEQHDNAAGHEMERRLTASLLDAFPKSAIAMEMFERNEQVFVDLYLNGRIQAETLIKITDSANWGGGKDTWNLWYQPIVDTVKEHRHQGAHLKAANCPRAFVKLARLEGFDVLESIGSCPFDWFALPDLAVDDLAYHDRFIDYMTDASERHTPKSQKKSNPMKKASLAKPPAMTMGPEAFFRAQQTWDASMARSVLEAKEGHPKVILFVGEFHMAYAGGLIQRILHGNPDLKLAGVSVLRSEDMQLEPEDKDRADFIIYTQ